MRNLLRGVYLSLSVVAVAAAVLSFSALRDLALLCGFAPQLAWLLPVVLDAGAAAGSLVWLGGAVAQPARRFARALALALLALSVAANALGHGLEAFGLVPAWWVVVIVSAVAPAVLGAVVHLAVLVGRAEHVAPEVAEDADAEDAGDGEPVRYQPTTEAADAGALEEDGLSRRWDNSPPVTENDRAAALIAAGAGRRRLARELDITEYEARRLLRRARPTLHDPLAHAPSSSAPVAPVLNGVRS